MNWFILITENDNEVRSECRIDKDTAHYLFHNYTLSQWETAFLYCELSLVASKG